MVECRTAAARRASGRVSRASTPITLITTMSAFSLVPKPSREARVTGSVPRGTACSQMPYVVPPSAVAHQVTAIDQLTVAVKTATTVHATSSQDWPSRAGVVSRRRAPSPRSEERYSGCTIGVASSRLSRRRSRWAKARAVSSPSARSGRPISSTARPAPTETNTTTSTTAGTASGRLVRV